MSLKGRLPDRGLHEQEPDVSGIASRTQSILEEGLRQNQQQTENRTDSGTPVNDNTRYLLRSISEMHVDGHAHCQEKI